jgi:hypothetical protein
MSGAELAHVDATGDLVAPVALGAAAERFARNTLRNSVLAARAGRGD